MNTSSAVNHLKNLQIALRGLIIDIDKIQLALTELPPPRLGPLQPVPKTNGDHHPKRRRATHESDKTVEN